MPTAKIFRSRVVLGVGTVIAAAGLAVAFSAGPAFALSADSVPVRTISGPDTLLDGTTSIAVSPSGLVYAANAAGPSIDVYAAGATGDSAPIRVISGSNTGITYPAGLAVSSSGYVYVTGYTSIQEFTPTANGNVHPFAQIAGLNTRLQHTGGLAFDSSGRLWVDDIASNSLLAFAPGADGNATPVKDITGVATDLASPVGIAIDAHDTIYAVNQNSSVTEYPTSGNGDLAPTRTISGSNTGFDTTGILYDAISPITGELSIADAFGAAVYTFAPGADGNVAPTVTPGSDTTTISAPANLAYDKQGFLYMAGGNTISVYGIAVTAISPTTGPAAGGTTITITGTGFTGATSVAIGGKPATDVTVVNSTTITAKTPAHASGSAAIVVTSDGSSATAATAFTYAALAETGVDPMPGVLAGSVLFLLGVGITALARRRSIPRVA